MGFTLVEVVVATAVFLLFALGIYGTITTAFKIVYRSRLTILENAIASEELEVARNVPYNDVGIVGGVPAGVLPRTKLVARNGIIFTLTTTVRNIDDPFDGTVGGNPNDLAPADYKLVEMAVICDQCRQVAPLVLSTMVGPKNLEGASQNGALFIHVFDSAGQPVSGANVQVVNSATTPNTIIDDVTDNAGYLRIIDAPTGTLSYAITVNKSGYSSDYTVAASQSVLNPVKPPANVVSQTVTEISFQIDRTAAVNLQTLNAVCAAIGNAAGTMRGTKLIGTDPLVYKFDENFTTNGGGQTSWPAMEWDMAYYISTSNTAYDIAGSIPQLSFALNAGTNQNVTLVLAPHTANSFLVKARDAGTGLPLSDATVAISGQSYSGSLLTGVGYVRQTDWSGGSGQAMFINDDEYWSDDGGLKTNGPAGDVKLRKAGNNYLASGWLESSTFDLSTAVDFKNVIFEPLNQPPQTGSNAVRLQLATSNTSTPASWNFVGPDGTAATFYTPTSTTMANLHDGNRYFRYRLFLTTADTGFTPEISEVSFTFTTSCTPPGQAFFSNLSSGTYTIDVGREGYASSTGQIDVSGATETIVNLSTL